MNASRAESDVRGLGTGTGKSIAANAPSAAFACSAVQPACFSAPSTSRRESPRASASRTNTISSSFTAMVDQISSLPNDPDRNHVHRVVSVTQAVPVGLLGLSASGEIDGTRAQRDWTWFNVGDQLPPLPAVLVSLANQAGLLPR